MEKHHILPKHMGGTDDPSNIEYITVEEHAEKHRILYEKYGHKWDYLAWKGRTGNIGREEIMKEVYREAGKKGGKLSKGTLGYKYTPEQRKRLSDSTDVRGEKNPMWGKKHSAETRKKQSEAAKKRWLRRKDSDLHPATLAIAGT